MKLYMLVGCPGSGKSWVANQMKESMDYIPHDNFIKTPTTYLSSILSHLKNKKSESPILIETPFSISQLKEPLEKRGVQVECVFIQENHDILKTRYESRDGKTIPLGHLTRQETYKERAKDSGSFFGTSDQVLDYLKNQSKSPDKGSP